MKTNAVASHDKAWHVQQAFLNLDKPMDDLIYAGWWRRVFCLLYESLHTSVVLWAAAVVFTPLLVWQGHSPALEWLERTWLAAVLCAHFVYTWIRGGQTLPMKVWRIRVVDAAGRGLRWPQAIWRFVIALALWLGLPLAAYASLAAGRAFSPSLAGVAALWGLVTVLYAWFDPQKQFLHDRLAGTRLILLPKKQKS